MYRNIKRITEQGITIDEAINIFMNEKHAAGLTPYSLEVLERTLERFVLENHLSKNDNVSVVCKPLISNWINYLQSIMKPQSVNTYISKIRTFCYWCMEHDYLTHFKISLIKFHEEPIRLYTDSDLEKLTEKPKRTADFVECRTYATICFMLATGARAGTICNIKTEDIDFKRGLITYTHLKNQHIATVPLSNALSKILTEFLNDWERDKTYLFCDVAEHQLTVSGLRQSIQKYCKKRNVIYKGVHTFRSNFARGWILNNGNAFTLQRMLTHSDMTMTKRYVRMFSDDLKTDFEMYSPLDNMISKRSKEKTVKKCQRPMCK